MVSLEFSESDEWTDDDSRGALPPLSAAERFATSFNTKQGLRQQNILLLRQR
jgi:hypothetical protein